MDIFERCRKIKWSVKDIVRSHMITILRRLVERVGDLWQDREEKDQLHIVIDAVLIEFTLNFHQIHDFHLTRWYS